MRFFALGEFSLCPETHVKDIFKFKGGLIAVFGLDHSGSQPFNYRNYCEKYKVDRYFCECVW